MEEKINIQDFIKSYIDEKAELKSIITRSYIPSTEKDQIVRNITTILFGEFDNDGKLIETDVYKEPDVFMDDFFVTVAIIGAYTNIDVTDKVAVYDAFKEIGLYEDLLIQINDADKFENMLYAQIKAKREYIKDNQKSSMDEVLETINGLVLTLTDKAKELDVKKLEKIFKKLNPQEVIKAYQKSGIGEGVRDQAIQDLAKENKELKNQISARNVMVDKKVD